MRPAGPAPYRTDGGQSSGVSVQSAMLVVLCDNTYDNDDIGHLRQFRWLWLVAQHQASQVGEHGHE